MKIFIIIFFVMYRIFKWILFFYKINWVTQLSWEKDGVLRTHVFIVKLCQMDFSIVKNHFL
jgi:hypothetical protein